jgi:hypothetical protein
MAHANKSALLKTTSTYCESHLACVGPAHPELVKLLRSAETFHSPTRKARLREQQICCRLNSLGKAHFSMMNAVIPDEKQKDSTSL